MSFEDGLHIAQEGSGQIMVLILSWILDHSRFFTFRSGRG